MRSTNVLTIIFLYIVTAASAFSQTKAASAELIMKDALAKAANTQKNVFIIFHASWCGWCHKMDNSMNDEKLKFFFDNSYVVIHLTVDETRDKKVLENPGAAELRKKYNGEQQGLPYWFILDAKGNFLADSRFKPGTMANATNLGCPASNEEVNYFVGVLKKTSSLNEKQLALIQQRFLKNKE